jgi:hypothetical protein
MRSFTNILRREHAARLLVASAWVAALTLPLVGLCSLLMRRRLDPAWDAARLHLVLFLAVGGAAFLLAYVAGQAAAMLACSCFRSGSSLRAAFSPCTRSARREC